MGQVYKAWDPVLDRPVALKYLRGRDPGQIRRMLREARAQAKVAHEHVCPVYEAGEVDGKAFVAMRYVDGPTLAEAAEQMSTRETVEVLRRVAEAVQAAHGRGLIHRDLKPGNVLVERTEEGAWHPYVVDFGLALDEEAPALTTEGRILGTPAYMAPEQVEGPRDSLDRRVDVYALGAMAYHLLAGEPPFTGTSRVEVWMKVVREDPRPLGRIDPSIPRDLRLIVERCLEKEPGRRYPSARLLAEDLDRFLAGEPILARPPSLLYRARKRIARHRALSAVSLAAALMILVLLGAALVREARSRERTRLAQRFGQEAERLAGLARMIHLAPRHDIRGEVAALRDGMDRLAEDRDRLGAVAEGPASYALGVSALGLGDLDDALGHLTRAWNAGHREARVALALGRVHGRLYRREISVLRHLEADLFEHESAGARRRHLEPALRFLRAGLASGEGATPYLEALLAFHEGDLDRAEALSQEALDQEAFLYEAALLRGDTDMERAFRAERANDIERARALYRRAGQAYGEAMAIGRSDPAVYEGECLRHARLLAVDAENADLRVPTACTQAVDLDPERARSYEARARVLGELASWAESRGADFEPLVERTVADAERALELDPDRIDARMALSQAYRSRAARLETQKLDATEATRKAIRGLEELVERHPLFVPARSDLGAAWARHAYTLEDRGEDPEAAYRRAIRHYREATRLAPSLARSHGRLGLTLSAYGERLQRRGEDPTEPFDAAERALERALELGNDSGALLGVLGYNAWARARWEWATQGDAAHHFDRAADWFERAFERAPERALTLFNQALMHVLYSEYLLETGRPERAAEVLGPARGACSRLSELSREQALCLEADLEVQTAAVAVARGTMAGEPATHLRRALALAEEGSGSDPVRCGRAAAEAHRRLAAWRRARDLPPEGHLGRGLARIEELLERNPEDSVALWEKAQILLEGARSDPDSQEAAGTARAALDAFERFYEASPSWEGLYQADVQEARALARAGPEAGQPPSSPGAGSRRPATLR